MSASAAVTAPYEYILFYDGVCGLCDASVRWVMHRAKPGVYAYAPLQGETAGKELPEMVTRPEEKLSTVVLLDVASGVVYTRSDAVLRVWASLPGWAWVWVFVWVPRVVRDALYRVVAAVRYKVWGRKDVCGIVRPPKGVTLLP